MSYDGHKNFSYSTVATAPSPATSGTSLVVQSGDGALFPAVPFNATIWPTGASSTAANAEIVRVTGISTDTLTIVRAQEGSSARSVVVGDQIAASITSKVVTDIENTVQSIDNRNDSLWAGNAATGSADYEFDAVSTSLPSGWSWFNQGTSSYREFFGAGRMTPQAGAAATAWRGITTTPPSDTTWTMYCKVASGIVNTNFQSAGIFLTDGTKVLAASQFAPNTLSVQSFTTATSATTTVTATTVYMPTFLYYRVTRNSSSSLDIAASVDGISWIYLTTAYNVNGLFATGPTGIGIATNQYLASPVAAISCHWIRFRTGANPVT